MTNTVKRHSAPGAKRCAFTGYRPQKMPFGFNESDPRCIDFKRRVKETIQALYDMGYRHFISGGALGMDSGVQDNRKIAKAVCFQQTAFDLR